MHFSLEIGEALFFSLGFLAPRNWTELEVGFRRLMYIQVSGTII